MNNDLMYREEILEHWRNPLNFGELKNADLVVEQINPLCGDEVKFFFKLGKGKVVDVKFTGSGCAISVATSSMLSEYIKGKSIKIITKIVGKDVLNMIGGTVAPARLKCAFLPLETLKKLESKQV